jgi:hypothetical protein
MTVAIPPASRRHPVAPSAIEQQLAIGYRDEVVCHRPHRAGR